MRTAAAIIILIPLCGCQLSPEALQRINAISATIEDLNTDLDAAEAQRADLIRMIEEASDDATVQAAAARLAELDAWLTETKAQRADALNALGTLTDSLAADGSVDWLGVAEGGADVGGVIANLIPGGAVVGAPLVALAGILANVRGKRVGATNAVKHVEVLKRSDPGLKQAFENLGDNAIVKANSIAPPEVTKALKGMGKRAT
jgi:hypothetical protein